MSEFDKAAAQFFRDAIRDGTFAQSRDPKRQAEWETAVRMVYELERKLEQLHGN